MPHNAELRPAKAFPADIRLAPGPVFRTTVVIPVMKYMIPALVAVAIAGCATQEAKPAIAGTTWTNLGARDDTYIFKFREDGVLEIKFISTKAPPEVSGKWESLTPNFGTFAIVANSAGGRKSVSGTWTLDGDKLAMIANERSMVFTQVK